MDLHFAVNTDETLNPLWSSATQTTWVGLRVKGQIRMEGVKKEEDQMWFADLYFKNVTIKTLLTNMRNAQ